MLALADVTFGYDARAVVRGVSLTVARGELVALVGSCGGCALREVLGAL